MKNNLVAVILVAVFVAGALATAILAINYHNTVNTQIRLQTTLAEMQRTANAMQTLAAECVEYSRRHPTIDPILQQFDLKPRTAPGAALAPASRPAR